MIVFGGHEEIPEEAKPFRWTKKIMDYASGPCPHCGKTLDILEISESEFSKCERISDHVWKHKECGGLFRLY